MKIATLGPAGTFSHEAATTLFSDKEIELAPNFDVVFDMVESGKHLGFVPFENSVQGSVHEVLDLLVERDAQIFRTYDVNIHHALGAQNADVVTTIASHPQALAQCRKYLHENYHNAERFPVSSTAYALDLAREDPTMAVIAPKQTIEEVGLELIDEDLQENGNMTRFAVIAKEDPFPDEERHFMGLVFHPIADRPGLLHHILVAFKIYDVNLTKIENRPTGKGIGDYHFYVHFEGDPHDARVQKCLEELNTIKEIEIVKMLGEW